MIISVGENQIIYSLLKLNWDEIDKNVDAFAVSGMNIFRVK